MLETAPTEQQLITRFVDALRELPEVKAKLADRKPSSRNSAHRYDAQVDLQVAGNYFILLIEAKRAVYPRDVLPAVWQTRAARPGAEQPMSILVAESISPGAKALLQEHHWGYYDSGGSLYLPAPGAYVYIDKPAPKVLTKSLRTLFTGRRSQVLHALLAQYPSWFGVNELAQQAEVSPATTSQVLTELERFDWLEARGQGPSKERHLSEPRALLDEWVRQLATSPAPNLHRYFVPGTPTNTLLAKIGQAFEAHTAEYAISHEAAAQLHAPFLSSISQVRARVLLEEPADHALKDLNARAVSEGANLVLIEAHSQGDLLFRERIGDLWLASPIQIYFDLLRGEGRSKEMAEHFRKEKIGF